MAAKTAVIGMTQYETKITSLSLNVVHSSLITTVTKSVGN